MSNFCIISAPILAFPTMAALQRPSIFPHTFPIFHIHFRHTSPRTLSPNSTTTRKFQHTFSIYVGISNIKHIFPTHFSNILICKQRRGAFRTPSVCLIFYLPIPATFCCTHSPILRRKCSSIFIPLMVNCLMKSYAFSSFAFKLRFSAFNTSFSRFRHSFSYLRSSIFSKYAFSRSPELVFLKCSISSSANCAF